VAWRRGHRRTSDLAQAAQGASGCLGQLSRLPGTIDKSTYYVVYRLWVISITRYENYDPKQAGLIPDLPKQPLTSAFFS
jgi:hypothetical protein